MFLSVHCDAAGVCRQREMTGLDMPARSEGCLITVRLHLLSGLLGGNFLSEDIVHTLLEDIS
jgi:hypothetical protein